MGQDHEPAKPNKRLAENETDNEAQFANRRVGFTATRGLIGWIVLLVAVIAAVIAVSVACSPMGGGGGADLPGGY